MDTGQENVDLLNERTIFVLDHSAAVLQTTQDQPPSATLPLSKTLWSNMVEAVLEYCRIVFDLFHPEKWISVVSWDSKVDILTSWTPSDQNLDAEMVAFFRCGRPSESCLTSKSLKNTELLPGIYEAIELLTMPLKTEEKSSNLPDEVTGRIIYMTTDIGDAFPLICKRLDEILHQNKSLVEKKGRKLKALEILFLDLLGSKRADQAPSQEVKESECGQHSYQYLSARSGFQFSKQLVRLCESHYRLASTSVLEIPMKEEQQQSVSSQASQSASGSGTMFYGVELLHRIEATAELKRANLLEDLIQREKAPRSGCSASVRVSWAMPRAILDVAQTPCLGVYRVTPADVSGRASSCLIQFVLSGKSVRLDYKITRSSESDKAQVNESVISGEAFILTCHGRELYIHVLRPTPTHPPGGVVNPSWLLFPNSSLDKDVSQQPQSTTNVSTSPKASSRYYSLADALEMEHLHCPGVTHRSYRTDEFASLAKKARLVPVSEKADLPCLPCSLAREHLFRETVYWPLSEQDSIIYANENCTAIIERFIKEELDEEDIIACVNAIRRLKRSQLTQAKQDDEKQTNFLHLCTELDYFLRQHCARSTLHSAVRNCLIKILCLPVTQCDKSENVDQLISVQTVTLESEQLVAKEATTPGHLASAANFSPWTSTTNGRLPTLDRLLTDGKSGNVVPPSTTTGTTPTNLPVKHVVNPPIKSMMMFTSSKTNSSTNGASNLLEIFKQRQQQENATKKSKFGRPVLASLQEMKDSRIELYPHLKNAPPAKDVPVG